MCKKLFRNNEINVSLFRSVFDYERKWQVLAFQESVPEYFLFSYFSVCRIISTLATFKRVANQDLKRSSSTTTGFFR